jgi:DNA-binding transcriptional regulator GbsR (MarR family)
MPKVCVVVADYTCDQCAARDITHTRSGTEWTDVSDEEYDLLKRYVAEYNRKQGYGYTSRHMILVAYQPPEDWRRDMAEFLADAKSSVQEQQEREYRRKLAEAKRQAVLQAKRELKEREKLAELQQKYGG